MDLSAFEVDDQPFPVEVVHPVSGKPIGLVIQVVGTDSAAYQNIQRKLQNRRLQKWQRNRSTKMSAEQLEEEQLELLCSCIHSWTGMVVDGKEVEFSPDAAREILVRFPFVREQIDEAIGDRANFLKG